MITQLPSGNNHFKKYRTQLLVFFVLFTVVHLVFQFSNAVKSTFLKSLRYSTLVSRRASLT